MTLRLNGACYYLVHRPHVTLAAMSSVTVTKVARRVDASSQLPASSADLHIFESFTGLQGVLNITDCTCTRRAARGKSRTWFVRDLRSQQTLYIQLSG